MFTDRFIKFRVALNDDEGDGGRILNLNLHPKSIESYMEDFCTYTREDGTNIDEDCVRVYTRNEIYNVLMSIEDFELKLNHYYK